MIYLDEQPDIQQMKYPDEYLDEISRGGGWRSEGIVALAAPPDEISGRISGYPDEISERNICVKYLEDAG